MNRQRMLIGALSLGLFLASAAGLTLAQGPDGVRVASLVSTAFTYQGRLTDGGNPATGSYDFEFMLYDDPAAGAQVGSPVTKEDVTVTNGLFTVELDFGAGSFTGDARYLAIGVRPGSSTDAYTALTPRQALTAAPYALSLRPGATISSTQTTDLFAAENYGTGGGVYGYSASGTGGYFGSTSGHALVAAGPSLVGGRNPLQIAQLRWYEANTTGISVGVGSLPDQLAFDGDHMWVTSYGAGTVTKIRVSDGAIMGPYAAGPNPNPIAFDGYYIWVGSESSLLVTKIQASDGTTVTSFDAGTSGHWGMAFDGANIWVSNIGGSSVTKIRASDNAILGTYATGNSPTGVAFDGANIWVGNSADGTVTKLQASDGALVGTYSSGMTGYGLAFDGANIWSANGSSGVTRVRASDGAVLDSYVLDSSPAFLAFDGFYIWCTHYTAPGTISKLRASDGVLVDSYATGNYPLDIAFDGANMWVADSYSNAVSKH